MLSSNGQFNLKSLIRLNNNQNNFFSNLVQKSCNGSYLLTLSRFYFVLAAFAGSLIFNFFFYSTPQLPSSVQKMRKSAVRQYPTPGFLNVAQEPTGQILPRKGTPISGVKW